MALMGEMTNLRKILAGKPELKRPLVWLRVGAGSRVQLKLFIKDSAT